MDSEDRRSAYRTDIDIRTLPLFGSRQGSLLEYYLINLSSEGLQIGVVPLGDESRAVKAGDQIDLHVALRFGESTFDHGKIMWTEYDKEKSALRCGLSLEEASKRESARSYPVSLSLETSDIFLEDAAYESADEILLRIILESARLKVKIGEMLPRIRSSMAARPNAEEHSGAFLASLTEGLKEDVRRLHVWYETIERGTPSEEGLQASSGLSDLRGLMRTDLSERLKNEPSLSVSEESVLGEIRTLEEQLLINCNSVALLWLGYLAFMYHNLAVQH
jgi:hypothetical protein